jgi:hypothetical protein
VVNFRGMLYEARNDDWVRVESATVMNCHILMAHFDQSVDISGELMLAAMEKELPLTINLLAKLSGTMEEHVVEDVG